MHKQLLFLTLLAASTAGCYHPDLGDNPYLCSTEADSPACPIGFECQAGICINESLLDRDGGGDGASSGPDPANCPDKDLEPNETPTVLAATPIGYGRIVNLANCGIVTDKDYYKIFLKKMQSIRVTLRFKPLGTGGKLNLFFFGLATTSPVTEMDTDKSAESAEGRVLTVTPRFSGAKTEDWFFIKVVQAASGGGPNFYELDIVPQR